MQTESSNIITNELQKSLEEDMRRLLAGTDMRADGTAITAESLDQSIKNLFEGGYTAPVTSTNFEPTVSGANKTASVKVQNSGNGNGAAVKHENGPDISLPAGLQKLTGAKTVGEFLGNSLQTVAGAALTAVNPIAGLAFKGVMNVAKGATVADTVADIGASLNPLSALGVKALGAVGAYDKAEGLVSSAADAYKTLQDSAHVPTTLAGRNVINAKVESEKEARGGYDSNSQTQKAASQAALNRDNAPAYAQPGYGAALSNAKNPAASTTKPTGSDSSKGSYQSAGQIGATKSEAGHAPAGGVGPSPSKSSSGSSSGNGKTSSGNGGSSSSGGSKGGSSSSNGGGSRGNGRSGSGSYGGR